MTMTAVIVMIVVTGMPAVADSDYSVTSVLCMTFRDSVTAAGRGVTGVTATTDSGVRAINCPPFHTEIHTCHGSTTS